mmetsp:Transcript_67768/g.107394  ORF Transcript_67768/g.107394 Transcript_67768/m.107394 type:complete len:705 (-) Transcript_67768:136-2250(-)|eukprot:CAMPEP_0169087190 /NCGR_PEP_ID=MMETSP1015-20121227/14102_1 /TAXON_ID=342587 /ORGANISM="Karlodinium micrum, Strain CCMP2283" /LENGTH=704 /DNA_ID=CAMNT_0009147409 /DNA_START=29 /DNA_END=2143 /DNA_ORIENTATION=-
MSEHGSDGPVEEEDEEDYGEDEQDVFEDDDGKVQRKLHLFQCASVQQSIKRLWDLLPKDENGQLAMEGYVELNLRLQKCLAQEFVLERAIDSAIGDWSEDVREGQQSMAADEFAMFLFELSSLWCGPSVSLLVYLLFLNATFIAVTEARGAHTIGLRPLVSVERLPQPFFDLLSVQGWAKLPEEGEGFDAEQALGTWLLRNLAPESEDNARVQVQRQVFQVTHDVRSVLLFKEAAPRGDEDVLGLVKLASKNLSKISPIEARNLGTTVPAGKKAPVASALAFPELHDRRPPGPRALNAQTRQVAIKAELEKPCRSRSQPVARGGNSLANLLAIGDGSPPGTLPAASKPPPIGRAFDTKLAKHDVRGLILAGQATIDSLSSEASKKGIGSEFYSRGSLDTTPEQFQSYLYGQGSGVSSSSYRQAATSETSPYPTRSVGATISSLPLAQSPAVDASMTVTPEQVVAAAESRLARRNAPGRTDVQDIDTFLVDTPWAAPYKLPRNPAELYHKQIHSLTRVTPSSVIYNANKWQDSQPLVQMPFDRVMRKIPSSIRPSSAGPVYGPLHHPNEPIWFEMVHRLQGILRKQGKRAERRRRRRVKSRLFKGRSRHEPQKRDEGKQLREYLDRAGAELNGPNLQKATADNPGEFLNKVQEKYLVNQERLEYRPFRMRGVNSGKEGMSDTVERKRHVVRPVYVPPPPSSLSRQ